MQEQERTAANLTKEEMAKWIEEQLRNADYTETELIYGFAKGIFRK